MFLLYERLLLITLKYKSEPELFKSIRTLNHLFIDIYGKIWFYLWKDSPLFYFDNQFIINKLSYNNRIIVNENNKLTIQLLDIVQIIKKDVIDDNNYNLIFHEIFLHTGFKNDVELKIVDNKLIEIDGFNLVELFKEAINETLKQTWN